MSKSISEIENPSDEKKRSTIEHPILGKRSTGLIVTSFLSLKDIVFFSWVNRESNSLLADKVLIAKANLEAIEVFCQRYFQQWKKSGLSALSENEAKKFTELLKSMIKHNIIKLSKPQIEQLQITLRSFSGQLVKEKESEFHLLQEIKLSPHAAILSSWAILAALIVLLVGASHSSLDPSSRIACACMLVSVIKSFGFVNPIDLATGKTMGNVLYTTVQKERQDQINQLSLDHPINLCREALKHIDDHLQLESITVTSHFGLG